MKKIILAALSLTLISTLYAGYHRNIADAQYDTKNAAATPDAKIKNDIHNKVKGGWFSEGYDQVMFDVKDGIVTLKGSVETMDDKNDLEKKVRNMEGVKGVESYLKVQTPPDEDDVKKDYPQDTYSSPKDEQLNMKIRDNVSTGWLWNSYTNVSLNTTDGVVVLRGQVDDMKDQQTLMNEIQKIPGVKEVKSELQIEDKSDAND